MIAYQIAFDVEENATQEFSAKVKSFLPPVTLPASVSAAKDPNAMETDAVSPISESTVVVPGPLDKIHNILSGETSIKLYLEFLYRNNHTDLLILKNTKVACIHDRLPLILVIQHNILPLLLQTPFKMQEQPVMNF